MIKDVIRMYVFIVVMVVLLTDTTTVTLYAIRSSKLSVRTRVLPTWYMSEYGARAVANGASIVRTTITVGMLVGHIAVYTPGIGYRVTLLHGTRRYAQRMARKVA